MMTESKGCAGRNSKSTQTVCVFPRACGEPSRFKEKVKSRSSWTGQSLALRHTRGCGSCLIFCPTLNPVRWNGEVPSITVRGIQTIYASASDLLKIWQNVVIDNSTSDRMVNSGYAGGVSAVASIKNLRGYKCDVHGPVVRAV